jgi:alkyl hydroperoxide reductase subunit AhpC
MKREFLEEKERLAEKIFIAESDTQKAMAQAEEVRVSAEGVQKRLADVLDCPRGNVDAMVSKIETTRRQIEELQRQLDSGDGERREQEVRTTNELNR